MKRWRRPGREAAIHLDPDLAPWAQKDSDPVADSRRAPQWKRNEIAPGVSRCPADPDNKALTHAEFDDLFGDLPQDNEG